MQGPLSVDLLRAYTRHGPDGLPVDEDKRNLLLLQLGAAAPRQSSRRAEEAGYVDRFKTIFGKFWAPAIRQHNSVT
jgi:hypothetical protein